MTAPGFKHDRRRAWAVVRAMMQELQRQTREGTLISASSIDANGHIVVEGKIDLAMLAFVTEAVLGQEFGF